MQSLNDLKKRYVNFYEAEAVSVAELKSVEISLGVKLPDDFNEISKFYNGGLLGGISHNEISRSGSATNVVDETIRLRNTISLDKNYIVLAEPPGSLIVLNISGVPAVIWCDAVDAKNINSQSFANDPDVWESYSGFFEFLLDREESDDC
ncbi:SMI1/KNR4 family protein [Pseudomonas alliivorans]|nr:SMI1/KNR4 family protein [Pseudomonas alliivorans]MEE4693547.1 SMI1/KNR4 family protein [Pseudomonas alliivorans]MEE4714334.1 SMI1/KNR4 family protein [Pseudomonas alliivorans]MEE4729509.1 SMI1/KNR4 family protein [Pseudomonas alliivorans]MEE4770598.1 SMI1/KNR4 family protein [Pseudomonas alliivorans]